MSALNEDCRAVDELKWDDAEFTIGDRISFDKAVYLDDGTTTERRVGVIRELWFESWRDTDDLAYAELEDGRRVWFHRDHVAHATEVEAELGAEPEGAMF